MSLKIHQIPVLNDNYIFILIDSSTGSVAVVDPAEAAPVIDYLRTEMLGLDYILNTHHHNDHVGGNLKLVDEFGCRIYGPKADEERIPGIDKTVKDNDKFAIGGLEFTVFDVPGHTKGHIAYWLPEHHALFCGDTLFSLGCGRLFEGSPAQMWSSLQKFINLPKQTKIYCAHEYTLDNGRFAVSVDPGNEKLVNYLADCKDRRQLNLPTIPTELAVELDCNPFLRADHPALRKVSGQSEPADVFAWLRSKKDNF